MYVFTVIGCSWKAPITTKHLLLGLGGLKGFIPTVSCLLIGTKITKRKYQTFLIPAALVFCFCCSVGRHLLHFKKQGLPAWIFIFFFLTEGDLDGVISNSSRANIQKQQQRFFTLSGIFTQPHTAVFEKHLRHSEQGVQTFVIWKGDFLWWAEPDCSRFSQLGPADDETVGT